MRPNPMKSTIVILTIGIACIVSMSCYTGLLIYATFADCDPVSARVSSPLLRFSTIVILTIGIACIVSMSCYTGLLIYATFADCDPVSARSFGCNATLTGCSQLQQRSRTPREGKKSVPEDFTDESVSESEEEYEVTKGKLNVSRRMEAMHDFIDGLFQDKRGSAGVTGKLKREVDRLLLVIANQERHLKQLEYESEKLKEDKKGQEK
ncbi:unnamed protein product [Timema podura]|uniref:Uncharacterized protein n=1 Tax=Timema podura TaxID=61482 RepID=A0ABN7NWD7_TIMPD|nr:unnamed protein product [Timema podura]